MALGRTSNAGFAVSSLPGDKGLPGLNRSGDFAYSVRSLPAARLGGHATKASLTTALAGTNNDLLFTAFKGGADGNNIRVRYVVAGASTPLTVTNSGNDITVNVATNGSSAATSTSAQVRDAVNQAVHGLVKAENATGNDGTGVVAALAFTNLTGGANPTIGR